MSPGSLRSAARCGFVVTGWRTLPDMTAGLRSGPVFCQPGTVLTDHMFTVPLDHQEPGGEQIEVFAREVVPAGRRDGGAGLPWLVYLQGGPGFGSPRPIGRESWLNRALDDYRVLLLDQRGTGRSTPRLPGTPWPGWAARGRRLTIWPISGPTRSSETRS